MNIVVIDDGINSELYNLGNLKHNIKIYAKTTEKSEFFHAKHGTTCAAIIKKYATNVTFSSIKVLHGYKNRGKIEHLINGLRWCMINDIKLINMSLGSIDFRDFTKLKNCIYDVTHNGAIIVAALNNKNFFTYPACNSNVIGVRCEIDYIKDQYKVVNNPFDGVDIAASGRHLLNEFDNQERYTKPSNSYAAPLITALVNNILEDDGDITLEEIKRKLYLKSLNKNKIEGYNPYIYPNLDNIKNLIIVNINKKDCNLNKTYDSINIMEKISINCKTTELDKCLHMIRDQLLSNEKLLTDIDTLVLAFPDKRVLLEYIVAGLKDIIISNNLNLVLLNNLKFKDSFINSIKQKVWAPYYYQNSIINSKKRDLDIPVIGIYDYSRKGIFTDLLFSLNKQFRNDGYYSVSISNKYETVMIGMEFFPLELDLEEFFSIVYGKYRCDLLLVGFDVNFLNNKTASYLNNEQIDIKIYLNRDHESRVVIECKEKNIYLSYSIEILQNNLIQIYQNILSCFH